MSKEKKGEHVMKFKSKKVIMLLLVTLIISTLLTARGAQEQTSKQASEQLPVLKVLSFNASFDPNKNPQKEIIEEVTGYKVEYSMLPADTEKADEKLNITIASGSEYDILKLRPSQYYRLVKQGALMELDPYLDKSGRTIKDVIKPLTWEVASYNNKIYAVPQSNERPNIANSIAMRKDLLDKAGIAVPTTLDEFTQALRALKRAYPDKIPMTGPGRVDQQIFLNTFVPVIAGAFGIYNEWTDIDGTLYHYMEMPRYKDYLVYMSELYKEGLIDVDWPINTLAGCNEKLVSGKAIMDPYHYNDATVNLIALEGNFPEAELVYVNSLKGPGGEGVRIERKINYFISIPKSSPNAEHAIKFIDKMLEYDNFEFLTLGEEGVHFVKEGNSFEPIMPIFNDERFWSYWYLMGIDEYLYPDMWLARIKKDPYQYANFEAINKNLEEVGKLDVTGFAPTLEAVANNQQALRKMVDDYTVRLLVGSESIAGFDKFLERWKMDGGADMVKEMNDWYKVFIAENGKVTL